MSRRIAAVLALACAVSAQQPPTPESFFPDEYRAEFLIDLARLRELEIWDGLRGPLTAPLLGTFEQEYGFEVDDIDRIRGSMTLPEAERTDSRFVIVMTGNESVRLPAFGSMPGRSVDEIEIAGRKLMRARRSWDEDDPGTIYYSPHNGFLVQGHEALLRSAIESQRKGSVPAPELMRHTATPGLVAFFATHLNDVMRSDMPPPITADWLVESDPLTFLMYGLRVTGAEDEEQIVFEGMLQCERGTEGPAHLEKKIREGLVALQSHPRLGALKSHWEKVEVERDGRDVRARIPLGPPRRAGSVLAQLLLPIMMTPAEAAAPAPAAAPAKADKDK